MLNDPSATPLEYDVPRALDAARVAWAPVRRAVRYATFDAWTLAACGVLSVPCISGTSAVGLLTAALLAGFATVEFLAVRRLRRLDPSAVKQLMWNQVGLGVAVAAYAGWNLYLTAHGQGLVAVLNDNGLRQAGPDGVDMVRQAVTMMYLALLVIGPAATAATALFYASRAKPLRAYLATTPDWLLKMHRDRGHV